LIDEVAKSLACHPDPKRPDKAILYWILPYGLTISSLQVNFLFKFWARLWVSISHQIWRTFTLLNLTNLLSLILKSSRNTIFVSSMILSFIWCGSLHEMKEFEVFLNNLIPGIKVTLVIRSQVAEFLDILIYKQWMLNQTVFEN
jgi:hypothetical protein